MGVLIFASWPHDKFGMYAVRSAYNMSGTESFFSNRGNLGKGLDQTMLPKRRIGSLFGQSRLLPWWKWCFVIRLRRIYNSLYSMLDYISVPRILIMFLYHFSMIYGTNLLTRCLVPVRIFWCLFVSEKLFGEVSRNQLQIYTNYFPEETIPELEGRLREIGRASCRERV